MKASIRSAGRRYWRGLLFATSALWTAYTVATGAFEPTAVLARGSTLVGLLAVSETLFVAGLALMAGSVPALYAVAREQRARGRTLPAYVTRTSDRSRFWRVGLVVNLVGALGTSAALLLAVLFLMPKVAWGVAGLVLLDALATLTIRWPFLRSRA
jgi:hypothetical protein